MEKSVILYSTVADEVSELKTLLDDANYELYEISSLAELSQTLPILENLFIINFDFKQTKQYLESLSEYTVSQDCFCLLVSHQTIPPHLVSGLKSKGLNEIIKDKINQKEIFSKINAFFEEGYLGIESKNFITSNSDILVFTSKSSKNVSFDEKQRVERLLSELKSSDDKSIMLNFKKKQIPIFKFSRNNHNSNFSYIAKNKIISNKSIHIEKEENFFEFDYRAHINSFREIKGKFNDNKFIDKFYKYEEDQCDALDKSNSYEQDNFKFGEGLAEFKQSLKVSHEEAGNFIVTQKISADNPFFQGENIVVDEKYIHYETLREVTIYKNKDHDFQILKGLAEILGIGAPNKNKLFLYLNFVVSKFFNGTIHLVRMDKNKQIDLTDFIKNDKVWIPFLENKRNYFEGLQQPQLDNLNEHSVFAYPFFWDRVKIGYGLILSPNVIAEQTLQILELLLLSAKNLIKDNS